MHEFSAPRIILAEGMLTVDPSTEQQSPAEPSHPTASAMSASKTIRIEAPAKLNLNLLVNRKAESGYHPLDSVVARISLHDVLELTLRDDGEVTFQVEGLECGPTGENLAFSAARVLKRLAGSVGIDVPGVDIHLCKYIPPGGGLGGGSSDAASTLLALNELWNLQRTREQLSILAAELGSDVPLFLGPSTLRMTGRGETVEPLTVHPFWAVLHLPELHCPTRDVYRAFDDDPPQMAEQLDLATFAQPPSVWRERLVNQLAPAAMRVQPELAERFRQLNERLPAPVCLTGSGSAMFMLADTPEEAHAARACLPEDLQRHSQVVANL